jgi:hypothetical protein
MQYNGTCFLFYTTLGFVLNYSTKKHLKRNFKKWLHLTFLVIFHLKMIICQNFNLPHIYGHCLEKDHL